MVRNKGLSKELLPHIGTTAYKKLDFKIQLFLYNMYLHEPSRYKELVGVTAPDDELKYVDDNIRFIVTQDRVGLPEPQDAPIYFIRDFWGAYLCYYNPRWYEEAFSPIDDLGLQHRRVFSFQLFTFPLLALDTYSVAILKWLHKNLESRDITDIFFYLVKLRAAKEYFAPDPEYGIEEVWNSALLDIGDVHSLAELNGNYPVMLPDTELTDQIEDSTFAVLSQLPRGRQGRMYVPLVPVELYNKSQFQIKNWDLLLA